MRKILLSDYVAEKIDGGLTGLLVTIGAAHAVEQVYLVRYDLKTREPLELMSKDGYSLMGGAGIFSTQIQDVEGTMVLSDGRVITSITSKSGGDTFHSGEVSVAYYILTPNE